MSVIHIAPVQFACICLPLEVGKEDELMSAAAAATLAADKVEKFLTLSGLK